MQSQFVVCFFIVVCLLLFARLFSFIGFCLVGFMFVCLFVRSFICLLWLVVAIWIYLTVVVVICRSSRYSGWIPKCFWNILVG